MLEPQKSLAKLTFLKTYENGKILLLDEIKLAQALMIHCIQQSLDNKMLSSKIIGNNLITVKMHPNFHFNFNS